ncbi:ATP-binding cassette subfamily B protein [Actinoplanes lutulentus]|uniref:ATP-binding cassette subfamily B protein n=1 Tax=Actinoplanes lutulentus TaxID=1287878 RepID=A0A327ZAI2_9ACTN|nr:ABC transporter ATP-binding protein [Actinoplanes lutulentus]MBB2947234.1 ATP-binding cassette subfamily B protein [Actinoplanes lutulentus]RAK36509.1 ATP-binding cassette subfamily B protein [Actinoplanes lutulentus]
MNASTPSTETTAEESVLPELRDAWWEHGVRRRAEAGVLGVFAELPKLVGSAVSVAWRADRVRTLVVGFATLGSGLMATFGLLSTQRLLVELFAGGPTPDRVRAALPALALLAATTAVAGGLRITIGYAQNGLTPRVNEVAERRLFEATTAVRLAAFDEDAFADDMERATRGSDAAIALVQNTANMFAGLVNLLAVAVAVIVINPLLLVALIVATLPNGYAALRAGHLRYATFLAGSVRRRRLWVLQRQMAERDSAPELRSYGLRGFLLGQYDMVMGAQTREDLALARRVTTTTSVGALVSGVGLGGVWVLVGGLLWGGRIPLSSAVTCVVAVQASQRALAVVTFQLDRLYTDGQFFKEYIGFLERAKQYLPPEGPDGDRTQPQALRQLTVRGVSLAYPDRDQPAVDDVTLTIQAGQTVAFVGENGSGKTTLAAMIAGLRSPSAGVIEWNGHPIADLDEGTLLRRISVVMQEHHKWPYTAATNIAMGDIGTAPAQKAIEQAANRAAAHETILNLPNGYRTLLDKTFKHGQDLSGGQWQRITAARGFYRDADLLIMDEPSSALDPRAEDALFRAVRSRQGHKTTILITHRLANVIHADRIFVMHDGVLTEEGTHRELVAAPGRYAELFAMQASGYVAEPDDAGSPSA